MIRPIVLLTDFGTTDAYAGVLRGVLYREFPKAHVLDLSHGIPPYGLIQAAYLLKSSMAYFPKGSIFLVVVDPGVGTSRSLLAVRSGGHFLLGPDNGVLEWSLRGGASSTIRKIENRRRAGTPSATFHGRDILAPWAAALARDPKAFSKIGPRVSELRKLSCPPVQKTSSRLAGEVLFFDHFGNAITNLEKSFWPEVSWKNCRVQAGAVKGIPFRTAYGSGDSRTLLALINSAGHLEIARPSGSARNQLKTGDPVTAELKR